jgi:hypothetical protein
MIFDFLKNNLYIPELMSIIFVFEPVSIDNHGCFKHLVHRCKDFLESNTKENFVTFGADRTRGSSMIASSMDRIDVNFPFE